MVLVLQTYISQSLTRRCDQSVRLRLCAVHPGISRLPRQLLVLTSCARFHETMNTAVGTEVGRLSSPLHLTAPSLPSGAQVLPCLNKVIKRRWFGREGWEQGGEERTWILGGRCPQVRCGNICVRSFVDSTPCTIFFFIFLSFQRRTSVQLVNIFLPSFV